MNKDNAKDFLPLVQALAEGKTLQHRTAPGRAWHDVTVVGFGGDPENYRIKPEPLVVWVLYNTEGRLRGVFSSEANAVHASTYLAGHRIIKMVESED